MGTFTIPFKEVIARRTDVGLSDYPIFDESYRKVLNKKITDHYWNREIGQENIEMFTFAMRRKMNEIMPLYNAIYEQQAKKVDPLINFKTTSTGSSLTKSTSDSEGKSSAISDSDADSKSRAVNSDFPQTALSENGDYGSGASDAASKSTTKSTSESDDASRGSSEGSASMSNTSEGFSGMSLADMIANYANVFINTDLLIIGELETLFMGIWDNGDSFTQGSSFYFPYQIGGYFW